MKRLLFLWFLFLINLPTYAGPCSSRFAQTDSECASLLLWQSENFTQGDVLDQEETFQIIFHGITAFGWDYSTHAPKSGSWNEKLLKDPSLLAKNPIISASLLSEKKYGTFFGFIGFVLKVEPENIVGTSHIDAQSKFPSNEPLLKRLESFSMKKHVDIKPPTEILDQTTTYNEVVLTGAGLDNEIKITAVIVKCNSKKMYRLNYLSSRDFEYYLNTECVQFHPDVIAALSKLRLSYPLYAFDLDSNAANVYLQNPNFIQSEAL